MKAKDINEFYYKKLVSLDYSRKENDLISVNSINWFDLQFDLKDIINSFPIRHVKFDVDLMDIEDLDGEQQFYVFHSDGNSYLVDTQGYTYPRYVVKLEGFDGGDDQYERMEGLTPITDIEIIALALKSIVIDLAQEGFSQNDVEEYLTMKLEFMAKEVCATNTRLF
jgi:hypothetical protein